MTKEEEELAAQLGNGLTRSIGQLAATLQAVYGFKLASIATMHALAWGLIQLDTILALKAGEEPSEERWMELARSAFQQAQSNGNLGRFVAYIKATRAEVVMPTSPAVPGVN